MGALSGLIPFLSGLFSNFIDLIAGITLSVYFVRDGPRIIRWLSFKTPVTLRSPVNFLLHALDQSLGGYFRGSLLLALIGAIRVDEQSRLLANRGAGAAHPFRIAARV